MTEERPSDRLRKERDIINAASLKRSPSEQFWGEGNSANNTDGSALITTPLNNGPRPQGSMAAAVPGGLAQSEGLSRTQVKRRIGLRTDKYPFKTLAIAALKIHLGGDRNSIQIGPSEAIGMYWQLTNRGGKEGWQASYRYVNALSQSQAIVINYINPDSPALTVREGSNPLPIGYNYWIDSVPAQISINSTRAEGPPEGEEN